MRFVIRWVLTVQEFYLLAGRALRNIFRKPHYADDVFLQMDNIGVGSLPIVVLTGFFSGAVMSLQLARALAQWGQKGRVGTAVSITLVRELGPALTSLMVAGRNSSGMASELGSMKVTEQIDAMRALGTDPIQKLVTPRLIATCTVLPTVLVGSPEKLFSRSHGSAPRDSSHLCEPIQISCPSTIPCMPQPGVSWNERTAMGESPFEIFNASRAACG